MYIELLGRGDRLGANITCFIAQIIYAFHNKIFIKYNRKNIESGDNVRFVPYNQEYNNSIFIKTLFDFIDIHNSKLESNDTIVKDNMFSIHFFEIISKVLLTIKQDHFSYFKEKIYPDIKNIFHHYSKENGYLDNIPFNPQKTILVHLRLDDRRHATDYDGYVCAQFFNNVINNDKIADNETDRQVKNIYPICNTQAPLSKNKIQAQINDARQKNPDFEVIIVTTPNENTSEFPYRCIQSNDESLDLFYLCNSEVVILSRSTYALSCLYFGIASKVYLPVWGHSSCFGLTNKYDKSKFHYFY
jgi:hypothetical protein